jgi:hypothetical protein
MPNKLLGMTVMIACAAAANHARAEDAATEKTIISGKTFIDFTHINQESNNVATSASGTGLDVKRFYLGVDHIFDDMWSVNLTTDFNYVSNDAETQLYIKKAFVQSKFADAFVLRAGSADLPWVPFVENLYGYRYVENVLIDHTKFGTSADWGLHALGKFVDGKVNYAVSVINGGGYKNPTRTSSVDVEGRVSVEPIKGLTFAAGFYTGKLGQDTEANPAENTAERLDALVAYVVGPIRVGAEYFQEKNAKQVQGTATDKADGYSGWVSFAFTSQLAAFARYDLTNPSKDLAPDLENTYVNVGLAYKPRKNVDLAFVYKQDNVNKGSWSTSNGTIGGTSATTDGTYDEFGIWAQVAF